MPENNRDLIKRKKVKYTAIKQRTNHLLIIGIDNYSNGIAPLNNAVRDAENFRDTLWEHYQFDEEHTTCLFNEAATRAKIIETFSNLLNELTEEDNLIFYYSGHGEQQTIGNGKLGFWIPHDAILNKNWTYLANTQINNLFKYSNAHHVFGIVDSCYSGSLFQTRKLATIEERLNSFPSRWLLTAGRLEVVSDGSLGENSPFATALLTYLQHTTDKAFWVSDLCNLVLKGMEYNTDKQTPRGEPLQDVGHYGGQFVFYKKGYIPKEDAPKSTKKSAPRRDLEEVPRSIEEETTASEPPQETSAPPSDTVEIDNSKNVIHGSTIHAGGNVHIGDIINAPEEEESLELGTGQLLHDIPDQMQLHETSTCIVRIAKDKKILLEDLQTTVNTVIKDLKKITKVMGVELIDISGGNNFNIVNGATEEQYIDQKTYTQWTFYVTPKRNGTHQLQLKISTVKIINHKERKKDIALLETVSVVTASPTSADTSPPTLTSKEPPTINTFEELKVYLKSLISQDLQSALETYDRIYNGKDHDITLHLGSYNGMKDQFAKNLVTAGQMNQNSARIRMALLDMIDKLKEEEVYPDFPSRL